MAAIVCRSSTQTRNI